MAVKKIFVEEFIAGSKSFLILDVRSPGEFAQAHIPGAISLPLFSDEERKVVGTAYKQQSRQAAIKIGLDYFGVKMRRMVENVETTIAQQKIKTGETNFQLNLHCWRGGMRSAAVAWLLDMYGYNVSTLSGGYKSYRKWVLDTIGQPVAFKVLGGYTGSGKTVLLKDLEQKGQPVLNLEQLANHKGSAFGALGEAEQPSQEMFENKIAENLYTLSTQNCKSSGCIWVEDESLRIGLLNIPQIVYENIRQSPVYFLDIPFEERLTNIVRNYGRFPKDQLIQSIERITKRLGGLETKNAINFLGEDKVKEAFEILLRYYDKWYNKGLQNRKTPGQEITKICCETVDQSNIEKLI